MTEEKRHWRKTRWELRTTEATGHVKESWPGRAYIVDLIITKTTRKSTTSIGSLYGFRPTLATSPEALLRLIWPRWSIENEGRWVRDTQLDKEANRIGAPVFSFLQSVVMNLLRRGGYRSIRRGLRALGGVQLAEKST